MMRKIVGFFMHLPHLAPLKPTWKYLRWKRVFVFTATYNTAIHIKTREGTYESVINTIPLTEVKFGRNEKIPQLWDFADNTTNYNGALFELDLPPPLHTQLSLILLLSSQKNHLTISRARPDLILECAPRSCDTEYNIYYITPQKKSKSTKSPENGIAQAKRRERSIARKREC